MAGALAVLCDGFQGLSNQVHITLIYIKAQQPQSSGGAPADTVQELKSLAHQIVVCLVVLVAQKVLDSEQKKKKGNNNQFNSGWTSGSGSGSCSLSQEGGASTCRSKLWFSQSSCR